MNIEVLTPQEAAAYLKVSAERLKTWRREGGGPRFMKWGHSTVRYKVTDLEDWLEAQQSYRNQAEANAA